MAIIVHKQWQNRTLSSQVFMETIRLLTRAGDLITDQTTEWLNKVPPGILGVLTGDTQHVFHTGKIQPLIT